MVARGEVGFIQVKHLVSALPEEGERPTKASKRLTLGGWEGQEEEEIKANPTTRRQLERMHMVFRTTLLVSTAPVPQFSNLSITKKELDSWYEWFYGEDIAGRSPHPSPTLRSHTALCGEKCMEKDPDMVHGGMDLSEALRSSWISFSGLVKSMRESTSRRSRTCRPKAKGRPRRPPDP